MMRPDLPGSAPRQPGDHLILRNPRMPQEARYALLRQPTNPMAKPVAFDSLAALAAALHRDRRHEPIQLFDAPIYVEGENEPRQGVSIWTLDVEGGRSRYLGWAWLNGGGRTALQAGLADAGHKPGVPVIRRAA